ncbi:MAG: alpha/beta fold hydrolase [Variibacter sp.]
MDHRIAQLGHLPLQSGDVLKDARLAYKIFGETSPDRPVIVYPTSFGTTHRDLEWLIGAGKALDPERYLIVMINLFGNGLSSSPSNAADGQRGGAFPPVTMYDNIDAQYRLVAELLGIDRIALVVGFSMGAQAAFHWAARYPDFVQRITPICGSARTSHHNFVFLEGVKAALQGDPGWDGGAFTAQPAQGLRAMARVYAGWGLSQAFYREETYLRLGFTSLEDFIVRDWQARFRHHDGNDLLAMIHTWQSADIAAVAPFDGDLTKALAAIEAEALVMPSETDLYFPLEDSRRAVDGMKRARLLPIPTIWGHRVNNPIQNPADAAFVDHALRCFLDG